MEHEAMTYAGDLANIHDPQKAREIDRRAEVIDRRLAGLNPDSSRRLPLWRRSASCQSRSSSVN